MEANERIKVSEEEKARRKALNLPVTKELRYMREKSVGQFAEYRVTEYEIVAVYMPSETPSLLLTLETGEQVRILSDYFSMMQKPSFERDVKQYQTGGSEE